MIYSHYFLQVSIDTLSWEFSVMTVGDENIVGPPKVGIILQNLKLFKLTETT